MSWLEPDECALCHRQGQDIHRQLVHWLDAPPGMAYEHVPRCDDRAACRARVPVWPLIEKVEVKLP